MRIVILCIVLLVGCRSYGQGYIGYKYVSASTLKDEWDNEYGSGNMQVVSGAYTFPLSVKRNEAGQLSKWSVSLSGTYATLSNDGQASGLNPPDILNGSYTGRGRVHVLDLRTLTLRSFTLRPEEHCSCRRNNAD